MIARSVLINHPRASVLVWVDAHDTITQINNLDAGLFSPEFVAELRQIRKADDEERRANRGRRREERGHEHDQ